VVPHGAIESVPGLPVLGTGKLDLQTLREMALAQA